MESCHEISVYHDANTSKMLRGLMSEKSRVRYLDDYISKQRGWQCTMHVVVADGQVALLLIKIHLTLYAVITRKGQKVVVLHENKN